MISGRYVRDDEVFMIPFGNGMQKIEYVPIKTFQWEKPQVVEAVTVEPKKRKSREWIRWSIVVAAFLLGTALGALIQQIYYAIPLFIVSLGWIALVAWCNRR